MKTVTNTRRISLIMSIILICITVLSQAQTGSAQAAISASRPADHNKVAEEQQSALGQSSTPLQDMLNPDGTLNLLSGFSGSLDPKGWELASHTDGPPRFVRSDKGASSEKGQAKKGSGGSILGQGDDNWDGQFGELNGGELSGFVNSIALSVDGTAYFGGNGGKVASWSPADGWNDVGGTFNDDIYALAVSNTGLLYAGGAFTSIGTANTKYFAKWNGSSWVSVGGGMNSTVKAIDVSSSGTVFAGGSFTSAGGAPANRIAKWDGSTWSALGTGTNSTVATIVATNSGLVYAGGYFTSAGGVTVNHIAKWNGITWSGLGSTALNTGTNGNVYSVKVTGSGDVYAGGNFASAGGLIVNNIAKWNGSSWSALSSGLEIPGTNGSVFAMALSGTGEIYAGGSFTTAGGITVNHITRWNGTSWSALGVGLNKTVYAVRVALDRVYAGGIFDGNNAVTTNYAAYWTGARWSAIGSGIIPFNEPYDDATAYAVASGPSGKIYVGGVFEVAGGVRANDIAQWGGKAWSVLGDGTGGIPEFYQHGSRPSSADGIKAIAVSSTGIVYVGGNFRSSYAPADLLAKWNGSSWSSVGNFYDSGSVEVLALAFSSNGDLYVGGKFQSAGGVSAHNIAKWNGTSWSALGSGTDNLVRALAIDNGTVYAGGDFAKAGGVTVNGIAKWNGSAWSALGNGLSPAPGNVYTIAVSSSSSVYVGGYFYYAGGLTVNGIAKWNGSSWSALGSGIVGEVYAIAISSTGNVYAGGFFYDAGGVAVDNVAKWNGSSWSALGSGITGIVYDMVATDAGDVYLVGQIYEANGKQSYSVAAWHESGQ